MAKQRIEIQGEGSITEAERGRVYRIRLRIPPTTPGSKARWSPQRTVHGTKGQARIAVEEYRRELEDELNNENCGLTVGQYAREFQERRIVMNTLSPLTLSRDELETEKIEHYFGKMLINEISTVDINKAYTKMRNSNMSAGAVHKVHAKLRQILKQAVKEEIIVRNPCDLIEDIKRPAPKERKSLSAQQAFQLARDLKEAPRNGCIVAVWLALATGLRRGEALGLTWSDVDLKSKRLTVSKQFDCNRTRRDPKSKSSKRNLSIDDGTVAFLTEWRELQSSLFLAGEDIPTGLPVCTNEHGGFIDPNVFNRWRRNFFAKHGLGHFSATKEYIDKAGVKHCSMTGYEGFNFHELRHTQATLLIGSGTDIKTVQHRLGHSSASLTMDIYAHAIEQNDRDAADVMGNLLG